MTMQKYKHMDPARDDKYRQQSVGKCQASQD